VDRRDSWRNDVMSAALSISDRGVAPGGHPEAANSQKSGAHRRFHLLLFSFALIFAACSAREKPDTGNMRTLPVESITVTGLLVDSYCYAKDIASGAAYEEAVSDTSCFAGSTNKGYPVAIVVDSGEVWALSENPRIFTKFLSDSARITGDIRSEGVLIPRTFDRRHEKQWQRIF